MKKMIALMLCLLLLPVFAACGSEGGGSKATEATGTQSALEPGNVKYTGDPVTLKWSATYLKPAVVKQYVDEFNATHDLITVEASDATYGSVSDYTAALAMNIATGDDSYDIFSMSAADFNKYINSGVAYCLDGCLENPSDVKKYAMDAVMRDGHIYAYPATNDVVGLYVNLDMLEGSGHTVDELATWDGMLKAGEDISKTYSNYGVLTHLGFGSGYPEFLWYCSMWSHGGDITTALDGTVTVTNPDKLAAAALDWKDLIMGPAGSTEFNNNIDYFVNGLCGMVITGQTALSEMDDFLSGGYSFNWTFLPVPAAAEGAQQYSSLGGWYTVINARTGNETAAIEFMNWLYFESDYIADMCRAYYQVSPLTSADAKLGDLNQTYFGWVREYIDSGKMACKPEIAFDSEVLEEVGKMLSSVVFQSTGEEDARAYVDRFIEKTGAVIIEN